MLSIASTGWINKTELTSMLILKNQKHEASLTSSNEWLTIFVHGTFGCLLGLFSIPSVLKDCVGHTIYKELAKAQRKDTSNFLDQPMLQTGLIRVQPTYDLRITNGQKFSAYPLAKAFQEFSRTNSDKSGDTFYTFGWSGLLSQKQRRIEAVRFYNELTNELERYHKEGRYPKIRLIAHSHGGNLCLNLGSISDLISLSSYKDIQNETTDPVTEKALTAMFNYIKTLPSREQAAAAKHSKRFDHAPRMHISIDELILLGTPVQVETAPFFFSPTFKKIYHFYSEKDPIQALDFISSKKASLRKIKYSVNGRPIVRAYPLLIQSKIKINRKNKKYALAHKDLWRISWYKNENPLAPFPLSVITPLLIEALQAQPVISPENDININLSPTHLKIQTTAQGSNKIASTVQIKRKTFEQIKKNIKQWDPYHTSGS